MENGRSWTVKVWGTRGAVPVASAEFLEYGGNTSCISVACGEELVVFDAGSGITALGSALAGRSGRVHILLSHLHLDHIQGLVGFQPLHDPDAEIHLYGSAREGGTLRGCLERLICPPYWPLGLDDFRAHLEIHEIAPGERFALAGGPEVSTMEGNHPNGSLLYRLDGPGGGVVYTLDCELEDRLAAELTDFVRSCGLLIWDANFVTADLQRGWGHSTWQQGAALGRSAGARAVLMTHFSHQYTDAFLRRQERLAREMCPAVRFAREGMEIAL